MFFERFNTYLTVYSNKKLAASSRFIHASILRLRIVSYYTFQARTIDRLPRGVTEVFSVRN